MADTCGMLSVEQQAAWETDSAERAAATREKYRKKRPVTKPAVSQPVDN